MVGATGAGAKGGTKDQSPIAAFLRGEFAKLKEAAIKDEQEKLAPGFSVLHHVAHGKLPAQEPAQPEPTPDAAADLFAQRHPLDQHTVSLMPCCGHSH